MTNDSDKLNNGVDVAEDPASVVVPAENNTSASESSGGAAAKKPPNKKKIAKIVLSSVCLAIVAFLLFVAVWLLIDKAVNKRAVPMFCGIATLSVETGSMEPTVHEGDLIVIKKTDDYKIGDIITFLPEGDSVPTTHRIIRIDGDKYYTRGDANNAEDTRPITYDRIIGEYQYSIRYVGLFFRWLGKEGGWIYLAGIVVVIIIGVLLLKMYPADKKSDGDGSKSDENNTSPSADDSGANVQAAPDVPTSQDTAAAQPSADDDKTEN